MKITSEFQPNKALVTFKLLQIGQFFTLENYLFLKVNRQHAIALGIIEDCVSKKQVAHGKPTRFERWERVEPADAEINIIYE